MSLYGQTANKRQKTTRDARNTDVAEFFPGLGHVEYHPDGGSEDTLSYRYYNPNERIHGRTMEEWLRPSISFRHAFGSTGSDNYDQSISQRSWNDGANSLESYKKRIKAAFELNSKLGIKYWTFSDRDIAPEGETLEDTNRGLDEMTEFIIDSQQKNGVKPLWVTSNLHSHPRYMNGGVTSPEAQIVGFAGAQLKKGLELAHKLGSECFLFSSPREGYNSVINTDLSRELRTYSRLLKMAHDYKERLGYRGQLLIEPSCESNYEGSNGLLHHYTSDALSTLGFLKHYNLDRQYKINASVGHQLFMSSAYGMLGSVDATRESAKLDITSVTLLMKTVIEQGGMQPGGLNIGLTLRRGSVDLKDMFVVYVNCIDLFARGLRSAAKIVVDAVFAKNIQQQYISFHTGFGSRLGNGEATLEDCEDQAKKHQKDLQASSQHTEHWEAVLNHYV